MRDLLLIAIIFGALPVILLRPYIGVLLWSWISYMNPHRLAYGFMHDFPVAAAIGATTLVSLVFTKEPRRIPWTPLTITWAMFVAWMSFTTLFALIPGDAQQEWTRMIKIQLFAFITLMLVTSRERLNWLALVITASIGFYGLKGGIFTVMTGGSMTVWGPPGSFIEGNNELALALVMIIPLLYYLQSITRRLWLRLGYWGAMGFSVLAVLGSYSRGAFVAIAAMLLYFMFKSSKKLVFAILFVITLPIALNFMPAEWHERMQSISRYQEDGSALGRINAWWFAYNLTKHYPITGGGFDAFDPDLFVKYAPEPNDFHDAHSIYFEVLAEHGYVGLALFLAIGVMALRTGTWIIGHARDRPELRWARDLAAMTQVSLIGYAVGGAFLGLAYFDLYYHLVAIMVITKGLVEHHLAGDTRPAGETAADHRSGVEPWKASQ
ncbi:MAG TPA: putative O-glycosylation ligase, exosortase A system-associated [Acidiferrobacterales bacterium]